MIVTCKTTTQYKCLFPSLQIMHSSTERQLLPAVQYANCHRFERIDMHKSIPYCLSLQYVAWSVYKMHIHRHAEIKMCIFC